MIHWTKWFFHLKSLWLEIGVWVFLSLFFYGIAHTYGLLLFSFFESIRSPVLDWWIILFTEKLYYLWITIFFCYVCFKLWTNENHRSRLAPGLYALVVSGITVSILKYIFAIPRPYQVFEFVPLVSELSFSFPSAHTAIAFSILIPLWRISRIIGIFWAGVALLTGFARVYEYVHYPTDIVGGFFVGGCIGAIFSHPIVHRMISEAWESIEFRRQTFHFVLGFLCVYFHWKGLLSLWHIGVILISGLGVSLVSQYKKIPIISHCLERFDRPRDKDFPGRGAFYYFLAVFLCFLIWNNRFSEIRIAYSAILILAVGDSLNHLVAQSFPQYPIPWNRKKTIVGVLFGVVAGTFAAQFFVPLRFAFIATVIALLIETVPWRIGKYYIDDNLTVPLAAGGILYLFNWLGYFTTIPVS